MGMGVYDVLRKDGKRVYRQTGTAESSYYSTKFEWLLLSEKSSLLHLIAGVLSNPHKSTFTVCANFLCGGNSKRIRL